MRTRNPKRRDREKNKWGLLPLPPLTVPVPWWTRLGLGGCRHRDDGLLLLLPNTYDFFLCVHGSDSGPCLRFHSWLLPSEVPLLFKCAAMKIFPWNISPYSKKEREQLGSVPAKRSASERTVRLWHMVWTIVLALWCRHCFSSEPLVISII